MLQLSEKMLFCKKLLGTSKKLALVLATSMSMTDVAWEALKYVAKKIME